MTEAARGALHGSATLRLRSEEPAVQSWRLVDDDQLLDLVRARIGAGRCLVLVDGRSGGGKSTFAGRLAGLLDAAVVHTDDVAWYHDYFDWASLLVHGVLEPWRRGDSVDFRPLAWDERARPGVIGVPADARVLLVEGVGAARAELAAQADLVVWVQSDRVLARQRGIARDLSQRPDPAEAAAFWEEWQSFERPFLEADSPWSRADFVVNGTPGPAATGTLIAEGPLT